MATTTEPGGEDAAAGPPRPASGFRDPRWRAGLLKAGFGRGFWGFLAFAVLSGLVCYLAIGRDAFLGALESDLELLARTAPRIAVALLVAGLLWVLLPRDRVVRLIGGDSGLRGLVIATLAGMVTPGGPTSAFALLAVLAAAGADRGALVAYITAWAMLGLQRMLVWDVPFMGTEFAIARLLIGLPLPVLAGLIARRLPLEVRFVDHEARERQ